MKKLLSVFFSTIFVFSISIGCGNLFDFSPIDDEQSSNSTITTAPTDSLSDIDANKEATDIFSNMRGNNAGNTTIQHLNPIDYQNTTISVEN